MECMGEGAMKALAEAARIKMLVKNFIFPVIENYCELL
jgi:hypothetical protein